MDEKIEKILGLIQTLPADQVVIIADKCKTMSEISPRVQKIVDLVWKLNEKEQMIINKRFFAGRTQMEVAEEIGISQAQVSRLEKSAINRIKKIWK